MAIKEETKEKKKPHFFKNMLRIGVLVWRVDHWLFILSGLTTITMGVVPILMSYTFKLVIDGLVANQNPAGIISAALLGYLAFRYAISLGNDFLDLFNSWHTDPISRMKIEDYLNYSLAEKISSLDIDYFENTETQNLMTRAWGRGTSEIQNYIKELFLLVSAITMFTSSFIALAAYGIWMPLILTLVVIPRAFIIRNRVKIIWKELRERIPLQRERGYLVDILFKKETVREIRLFGARDELLRRLDSMQKTIREHTRHPIRKYLKQAPIPIVLETVAIFLFIYLQLPSAVIGVLSVGTFTFYLLNADRIISSAGSISGRMSRMLEMNLYTSDYFELMELPPLIEERKPGHRFEKVAPPLIEFQNVGFEYLDKTPILKKISFTIKPGEHIAIVGPNGAGKSTLIKLLLRFYDPTAGKISVNDFDLKDLKIKQWYEFVGTLFQDFSHYPLTIRDNIRLGNPKSVDTKRMIEAAKKSGAHDFIEKLPKGYEQRLGRKFDDSVELSQGQWQKLALARAFYEEPPILILDEPTSAIDAEAEAEIFENLDKAYQDKTLIFVSHRFSTVRNADKIIVLKKGQIAEEGSHEQLMKKDGIYARMFNKQAEGYID